MTFSEFSQFLHSYCAGSAGRFHAEFITIIVERIMEEGCSDLCPVLDAGKPYLRSLFAGREPFPEESAKVMLSHLDKERFSSYVQDQLSADSAGTIARELTAAGYENDGTFQSVGDVCADIYEQLLISIAGGRLSLPPISVTSKDEVDFAIEELRRKIDAVKPPQMVPPDEVSAAEEVYVCALFEAYGSSCNVPDFDASHLQRQEYANFREDFSDRRIDYFSAEAIKRGVQEVFGGAYADQFEVLKQETYDGIKNTVRRRFPDGYERMLAVMEQAVSIPVEQYLLAHTQYWIGNSIMCGVCHHLANEKRIKWV